MLARQRLSSPLGKIPPDSLPAQLRRSVNERGHVDPACSVSAHVAVARRVMASHSPAAGADYRLSSRREFQFEILENGC
jgi:hypothetical protein